MKKINELVLKKMCIYLYTDANILESIYKYVDENNLTILNLDLLDEDILNNNFSLSEEKIKKMNENNIVIIGTFSYFNIYIIQEYFFMLSLFFLEIKISVESNIKKL